MPRTILPLALLLTSTLALCPTNSAQAADDHAHDHAHAHVTRAVCVLTPTMDNKVRGRLLIVQNKEETTIRGRVNNLTPGEHGFHIHEFGDMSDRTGASAGGHFNPEGHEHGGPHSAMRHVGDLGNITADAEGVAQVDITVKGLNVQSILGRSFVVHGGVDDLKSQPAGDAGPRVAVGVIGVASPPAEKPAEKAAK
jgi:Cu-Zn family superoxide dismutase